MNKSIKNAIMAVVLVTTLVIGFSYTNKTHAATFTGNAGYCRLNAMSSGVAWQVNPDTALPFYFHGTIKVVYRNHKTVSYSVHGEGLNYWHGASGVVHFSRGSGGKIYFTGNADTVGRGFHITGGGVSIGF